MAERFPNEALAHLIELVPRANPGQFPIPTALYLGLFTSQTPATVPSADATLTGGVVAPYTTGTDPVVEVLATGGYARTAIGLNAPDLQNAFPPPVPVGLGMRSTSPSGYSFPLSTGPYSGVVNGFFITNSPVSNGQNTGKAFYYANFEGDVPVHVNAAGYTVTVAPFWHLDG